VGVRGVKGRALRGKSVLKEVWFSAKTKAAKKIVSCRLQGQERGEIFVVENLRARHLEGEKEKLKPLPCKLVIASRSFEMNTV